MGANYSNFNEKTLEAFIKEEYENQRQKQGQQRKKDFLVLSDLVNGMSLPEDYRINMCHLGMLFMMDWNKDGRFSLDDMQ